MDRKTFLARVTGVLGLAILAPSIKFPDKEVKAKTKYIGMDAHKPLEFARNQNVAIGYECRYNKIP